MTPVRKKSAGWREETLAETYVVCLECGKQFVYDWENMRLGRAVEIADGPPHDTEATKVPFRTKSKLRYLFWGSALSAAKASLISGATGSTGVPTDRSTMPSGCDRASADTSARVSHGNTGKDAERACRAASLRSAVVCLRSCWRAVLSPRLEAADP